MEVNAENCKCGKPIKHRGNCWFRAGLDGPRVKGSAAKPKKPARPKAAKPRKARQVSSAPPSRKGEIDPIAGLELVLIRLRAEASRIAIAIENTEAAKAALE